MVRRAGSLQELCTHAKGAAGTPPACSMRAAAGHRVSGMAHVHGCHLKRWTGEGWLSSWCVAAAYAGLHSPVEQAAGIRWWVGA